MRFNVTATNNVENITMIRFSTLLVAVTLNLIEFCLLSLSCFFSILLI